MHWLADSDNKLWLTEVATVVIAEGTITTTVVAGDEDEYEACIIVMMKD